MISKISEYSITTAIVYQAIADGFNISLYDDDNNGECVLFESTNHIQILDNMWKMESVLVILHRHPCDNIGFLIKFGGNGYNLIVEDDMEPKSTGYLKKFDNISEYFHWFEDPDSYFMGDENEGSGTPSQEKN